MFEESTEQHFQTRDYRPDDAPELAKICHQAIIETGSSMYSPAQCAAWASLTAEPAAWASRLQAAWVRVACTEENAIAGFGGIRVPGHIDLLFTAPVYNRQGVASLIIDDLLDLASAMGARQITVNASALARSLFERHGFTLQAICEHELDGEKLSGFQLVRG